MALANPHPNFKLGLLTLLVVCATACGQRSPKPPTDGSGSGAAEPAATAPVPVTPVTFAPLDAEGYVRAFEWRAFKAGQVPWQSDAVGLAENEPLLRKMVADVQKTRVLAEAATREFGCTVDDKALDAAEAGAKWWTAWNAKSPGEKAMRSAAYQVLRPDEPAVRRALLREDLLLTCVEDKLKAKVTDAEVASLAREMLDQRTIRVAEVRLPLAPGRIEEALEKRVDAINAFYEKEVDRYWLPPRRHIGIIRFEFPKNATQKQRDEIRAKAEVVLAQLDEKPSRWPDLVEQFSDDPSKALGGDFGWVLERQFPQAFRTQVGKFTRVIEEARGVVILRVLEKAGVLRKPLEPALRREIAATLLRLEGATDEEKALATNVATLLHDMATAPQALEGMEGVTLSAEVPVSQNPDGMVAAVGLEPALLKQILLQLNQPGDQLTTPYRTETSLVLPVLIKREQPSDADVAAAASQRRDAFAGLLAEQREREIVAAAAAKTTADLTALANLLRLHGEDPAGLHDAPRNPADGSGK